MWSPAANSRTEAVMERAPLTASLSMATTTSPGFNPASAAGDPLLTSCTTAPSLVVSPSVAVPSPMLTPRKACLATTSVIRSSARRCARADGRPKRRPIEPALPPPWLRLAIEDVIPMTRPEASNSGPPLLPGLIAASTWMALVTTGSAPVEGGDDARRHGAVQAERVADRHHGLADGDCVRVAERRRHQVLRSVGQRDHCQVGGGIGADQRGIEDPPVGQCDLELLGGTRDVVVGQHVTRCVDDHA